jgi:phosphoketolase
MDRENRTEADRQPLSRAQLELTDGWWRAANYLSVGHDMPEVKQWRWPEPAGV